MREAPSRVIAYRLLSEGAEVRAWDPVAHPEDLRGIDLFDTVAEAVRDADAAVIVTEWPELHSMLDAGDPRLDGAARSSSTAATCSIPSPRATPASSTRASAGRGTRRPRSRSARATELRR